MKMEFPLTYGLRKTGLPLILTSGKLKNVCFLIDTGSTHNSIFSFVYDHFKDEFQIQEEMQKTMGIEGNYQECQTVEATFNFEGTDYTSTFMIMDATSAMAKFRKKQAYRYMVYSVSNFCWNTNGSLTLRNEQFLVHNAWFAKHSKI